MQTRALFLGFLMSAAVMEAYPALDSAQKPSYWAFQQPRKPRIPMAAGIRNPIDAFLLKSLREKGLDFAPMADSRTLIRRIHFDLTGLPPAPENLDEPYDRAVERLLASPRYGERWARHWLDVVRFGETDGGEHNYERFNAWPYRDYVIDAFNRDLPYDQFVRDQIAGDLISPGDRSKIAATGFLVAGPWDQVSAELNKDPAMRKTARMDELDDMVTTVSASFLGLTVNCARCHDHKFDPIPTRDYYRMTAAFSEAGFGERSVATPDEQAAYDAAVKPLRAELAPIERELASIEEPASAPLLLARYRAYDEARRADKQRIPLNPLYNRNAFPAVKASRFRLAVLATAAGKPRIEELSLLPARHTVTEWTAEDSASAEKPVFLTIDLPEPATVSELIWASNRKTGARDGMITIYRFEYSDDGKTWNAACASTDHISKLEADLPGLSEEELASALPAALRGRRQELKSQQRELQSRLSKISPPPRIYAVAARAPEKAYLLERGSVLKPVEEVTPGALSCLQGLSPSLDATGGSPDSQNPGIKNPRVRVADWVASPRNPLTARVIVNRVWYHHFGSGIVNTPSDFGVMGDRPSHPELLDWLAVSFMENGWSLKWLHRQILTSRAYQQSSAFNPKANEIDANNRLVWRMPLKRMDAETLRDSMLAVTGNLDLKAGGPSFFLQKKGDRGSYIYKTLDNDGPEVWRRAVYRFIVRGGERVMLDSFDCPDPSVATPQRQLSNTAVQALTLMNNAFVIRQSQLFAARLERESAAGRSDRIRRAYLLAFGRYPTRTEMDRAEKFAGEHSLPALCRAVLNSNEFIYVP